MRSSPRRSPALMLAGLLPIIILLASSAGVQAQEAAISHLWAAQTGPDQVSLAWDPVPGAVEYRIHAGDPDAAASAAARRPISTLSGSGRGGVLTGLRRFAGGLFLVALGSDGSVIAKAPFNEVVPVRRMQPAEPPASVRATVTGAEEVTLTWSPMPGATAYAIGRAAAGSGLQMVCALCSTEATYVDRDVIPGSSHRYTVAAIYPSGISARTPSNTVTPGDVADAAAGAPSGQPATPLPSLPAGAPATSPTPWTPPGQPAGSSPAYTPPGQPASTLPSYTPPGQPASTLPSYTPPGQPASTLPAYTPGGQPATTVGTPAGTPSSTPPAASGSTSPAASAAQAAVGTIVQMRQDLQTLVASLTGSLASQFQATTTPSAPTPAQAAAQAALRTVAQIRQQVDTLLASLAGQTGNLLQAMSTAQPTQTHAATPVATGPCRLDYQRADNMWAAFGRPDGQLGVESISVADGQTRVFVTDWKYEKQRNDGTNYYGSHLRIASNPGQREVKVQIRSPATAVAGLIRAIRGANGNFYIGLLPGETQKFQADLVDVSCN